MDEWWTYRLSDFLLFSPRTYYRMIERYNAAVWPGHLLTLGLGVAVAGLLRVSSQWRGRAVAGVLAGLWSWVAWAFIWRRYAPINWAAESFVWLFALEAVLLLGIGVVRGTGWLGPGRDFRSAAAVALFGIGLVVYPGLAPLAGREWGQAEVFGLFPDPTALATLGLMLLAEGRPRWALMIPPLIWCGIGGATLLAMGSPEAPLLLLAIPLALAAAIAGGHGR
jgi:hypothetical protein